MLSAFPTKPQSWIPACCVLACGLLVVLSLPAQQPDPAKAPDVTLRDPKEVTVEALQKLSGGDWGKVSLQGNFTAPMLECLRRARSIRELRVEGTGVNGNWAKLEQLPSLLSLELRERPAAEDLVQLQRLTQIRELALPQDMILRFRETREIGQLTWLTSLGLYGCELDDSSLPGLQLLVNLRSLDLSNTRVSDAGLLELLPHLKRLQTLVLGRPSRVLFKPQLTDACLPAICQLPELENLTLSGEITGRGLVDVGKITTLKDLSLIQLPIKSEGLRGLENSNIETLRLNAISVDLTRQAEGFDPGRDSPAIQSLKKMKSLKTLEIRGRAAANGLGPAFRNALPGVALNSGS